VIALALCAALLCAGCGREGTAPPTESGENSSALSGGAAADPPLNEQIEQKLDPLTKDDVEVYLRVMGAAANRAGNPTPADKAALERARKIIAGSASERIPTPDDVKTLERANLVAVAMDQIVAGEMKLDERKYRGIVEAVESVVPNPALGTTLGAASSKPVSPAPEHALTPLEKRLRDVNAANAAILAPYRTEIQKFIAAVRNPANLPK
jgi:hypothetical protein